MWTYSSIYKMESHDDNGLFVVDDLDVEAEAEPLQVPSNQDDILPKNVVDFVGGEKLGRGEKKSRSNYNSIEKRWAN